jgi:hypothetical protein
MGKQQKPSFNPDQPYTPAETPGTAADVKTVTQQKPTFDPAKSYEPASEPVKKKDDIVSTDGSDSGKPVEPQPEPSEQNTPNEPGSPKDRFDTRVQTLITSSQRQFNQDADKKRQELQSIVDNDPSQVESVNKQFQDYLTTKETEYNDLLDKWTTEYAKQYEQQDFQANKETNPAKSLGKMAWTTLWHDLPAQYHASKALSGSAIKKMEDELFGNFEPLTKEQAEPAQGVFESVMKTLFGATDEEIKKGYAGKKPDGGTEVIIESLKKSMEASKLSEQQKKYLVNNLDKVKNGDYVDWMNYAASAVGQGIGQIPASVGTKGASSIVQQMGSIYMDSVMKIAQEEGIEPEEVIRQGKDDVIYPLVFGVGTGLLDAIGAKGVAGAATKGQVMTAFRNRALSLLTAGGKEMITETVQTGLEDIAINKASGKTWHQTLKEFNWKPLKDAALQGGIAGIFLAGAGQATRSIFQSTARKPITVKKPTAEVIKESTQNLDPKDMAKVDEAAKAIQEAVDNPPEQIEKPDVQPITPQENAETVRADQTAVPEQGQVGQEGQGDRGPDVQQNQVGAPGEENAQAQQQAQGLEPDQGPDIPVDQKSGEVVPRTTQRGIPETEPSVSNIKETLVQAKKITTDESGNLSVKQNSGEKSQLFSDLKDITGDDKSALNEYLRVKDDAGEFKKKYGDWENSIMKEYGRAGQEYKVKVGEPQDADPNQWTWLSKDKSGNLVIRFNPRKVRREGDFTVVKGQYRKQDMRGEKATPEQKKEYLTLYDKNVTKLRDLKLHLIQQALIRKQKGTVTIEDKIRSLKEIERLNGIELAKDYYGEPMIFMHGGQEGITQFKKPGDPGYVANDIMTGSAGLYFTRSPKGVKQYSEFSGGPAKGKDLYYVFLRTKNPYYMSDPRARQDYKLESSETISKKDMEALKAKGYDSVVWDKEGTPKKEVVVFDPSQVEIIGSYKKGLTKSSEGSAAASPKPQVDEKGNQRDQGRQERLLSQEQPPTEPPSTDRPIQEETSPQATSRVGERIEQSGEPARIRKEVAKGDKYIPKQVIKTDQEAKKILEDWDDDEFAERVIKDKTYDIPGETRGAIAAQLYAKYRDAGKQTKDKAERNRLFDRAADIAIWVSQNLTRAGQETAIAGKIWKSMISDEDLLVTAIEKQQQQAASKVIEPLREQLLQTRQQIDEEIRKQVTEQVGGRLKAAKVISAQQKKKIADAFDALKVKDVGGTANDVIRVVGAAVWNGSVEAVKRAVLTGADVANAVQAGLDYVRQNYKGTDFDEAEYRAKVAPAVEQMSIKQKADAGKIDASKIKTPKLSGQRKKSFLNDVVEAHNDGKLTDELFEKLYAKYLGIKPLSGEDRAYVREVASIISEAEKFSEEVKNNFTKENLDKYKDLFKKAQKANKELGRLSAQPGSIWDTLSTIMQGNLLGSISLVRNVYSNVAFQPLRFASTALGTIPDRIVSGLAKLEILGKEYKNPTIDLAALQKGYFSGAWDGLMEGAAQLKTGQLAEERELRDINTRFDPVAAVRRWSEEDRTLSQKLNDWVEGTIGWPAEGMFRLLNLGDKPFRRAAERARAFEIGKQKGLKDQDLLKFVLFPDAESAQAIDLAGKEATFQDENKAAKFVQNIINTILSSMPGPLKLIAKSQIPFVRTPVNLLLETLNYALPPVTLYRGVKNIIKGNRRAGNVQIGQAIVGLMIWNTAKMLLQAGLMTAGDDDKKGKSVERRSIQYDTAPPNSINVSAMSRMMAGGEAAPADEDVWVNYKDLGIMGILMHHYSNSYFHAVKDGKEPFQNMGIELSGGAATRILGSSLEQSFLQGTNTLLEAIKDPEGVAVDRWLINTTDALSSIAIPRTISTISTASDDFIRDAKDDKLWQAMKNSFKQKVFQGDELPARVNLWGEKITGSPEGRNRMVYYLFDPTKFKEVQTDDFKWKIYSAWKDSKYDDHWLPSMPQRRVSVKGVKIRLTPEEYAKYATYVGEERKHFVAAYAKHKKKLDQDRVRELYTQGAERGGVKFLMTTGWNVKTKKALEEIAKSRE